jgi:hypothetical protein
MLRTQSLTDCITAFSLSLSLSLSLTHTHTLTLTHSLTSILVFLQRNTSVRDQSPHPN